MACELSVTGYRRRFIKLMRSLSQHEVVNYAEEIAGESSELRILMSVYDADVCVTHSDEHPTNVVMEFEFGLLPGGPARSDALLQLLELNGVLDQRGGTGFGVDADGSTVIFRESVCLAKTDRDSMLTLLRARGDQSAIWFQAWRSDKRTV